MESSESPPALSRARICSQWGFSRALNSPLGQKHRVHSRAIKLRSCQVSIKSPLWAGEVPRAGYQQGSWGLWLVTQGSPLGHWQPLPCPKEEGTWLPPEAGTLGQRSLGPPSGAPSGSGALSVPLLEALTFPCGEVL